MYTARIVVLVIALGAGGVAAYLASGVDNKPPAPVQQVVQVETVDVLVAKSEIALGQTTKAEDLRWQTWPKSAASGSFIRRNDRPDAINQIAGSIARAPIMIREVNRLSRADNNRSVCADIATGGGAVRHFLIRADLRDIRRAIAAALGRRFLL